MEELDSDHSEIDLDDETDNLVQDYLNDTRVESEQAKTSSEDCTFTAEELENIALYKSAITLNRETEAVYKKLEDSLVKMLVEVRKRLKENEAGLLKDSQQINDGICYLRCGRPYFKDKNNFPAPDNEDTIMMKQAQMYDFSQVCNVPGWTVKDKTELVTALLEYSRDIKRKEYRSQIARLSKESEQENLMEITRLERKITQLNSKSLSEIALPIDQDYDWDDLANSLNRRHTAEEYKALWKLFFHPSINKSNWSRTEHNNLERIALENNKQDWDAIAAKLDTGRTGYQCFVYYRTNIIESNLVHRWSTEETEYLLRVIDYFREGRYIPWGKVASAMDGRTKIQVYNRYARALERRKGRFLEEEDIVLMSAYEKYGEDFRKIAEFLPGRSATQVKTRFSILNKMRLSSTWTVEEDKKLLQIMANENSKTGFANATAHFPGKDRTILRTRYITLIRWMKAKPTCDISMAPRRGARRLIHGEGTTDLKAAISNLNKRIEAQLVTKKKARISIDSTDTEIESAIMAALVNEIIKEETDRRDILEKEERSNYLASRGSSPQKTDDLYKLLICLNACLNKEEFEKSKYAAKYPTLTKTVPKEAQIKLKCYSKKRMEETVQRNDFPTIWGKQTNELSATGILLPNYDTITGCRMLIKHFGARQEAVSNSINLGLISRKNRMMKSALTVLKERFITLFMWPILLSNEEPFKDSSTDYQPYVKPTQRRCLPAPTGPTIPMPHASLMKKRLWSISSDDDPETGINIPQKMMADVKKTQTELPVVPFNVGALSMDEE